MILYSFLSMASIHLLYQQGRRRELCTELKIHRIKEIRPSKEIRLKDYIFFPRVAIFSTCISVGGIIPPGQRMEEPLHAHFLPLSVPLQKPLVRDWSNFLIFPCKTAFIKSRNLGNAGPCFLAPLYPALWIHWQDYFWRELDWMILPVSYLNHCAPYPSEPRQESEISSWLVVCMMMLLIQVTHLSK